MTELFERQNHLEGIIPWLIIVAEDDADVGAEVNVRQGLHRRPPTSHLQAGCGAVSAIKSSVIAGCGVFRNLESRFLLMDMTNLFKSLLIQKPVSEP